MDTADIIAGLKTGLETVEKLLPVAGLFGGDVGNAVAVIGSAIVQVADNLLDRASDESVVLSSNEIATVRAIRESVAAKNDELAKIIAAS